MKVFIQASMPTVNIQTKKFRSYSYQNVIGLLEDGTEVYGIIGGFVEGINNEKKGVDFTEFSKVPVGTVIDMQYEGMVTGKDGKSRPSYSYSYWQKLGESPYKERADADARAAFLAGGKKAAAQEAAEKEVTKVTSKSRK